MTSRIKTTNRKDAGSYMGIPHPVLDSPNYLNLSSKAVKLMIDISRQYNGHNNGDLCAAYSLMHKRGWVSKGTLAEALEELLYYGFLLLSRQGGRNQASLHAITWRSIDECKGKLDIDSTVLAPATWKQDKDRFIPKRLKKKRLPL